MSDNQTAITDFFPSTSKATNSRSDARKRKHEATSITGLSASKRRVKGSPPKDGIVIRSRGQELRILGQAISQSPKKLAVSPFKPQSLASNASSPVKRALFSNQTFKSTETEVPAFVKFFALADTKAENSLPLSPKFNQLLDTFRCLENVVCLLFNRNESCTFDKIVRGVQKMTRRSFNLNVLSQIKSLYPESYDLSYEKQSKMSATSVTKLEFVLILRPLIKSDLMTPSIMLERKKVLTNTLLNITKEHHKRFCASLQPPVYVERLNLTRWHPQFRLEDVEDIPIAVDAIPKPSLKPVTKNAFEILMRKKDTTESEECDKAVIPNTEVKSSPTKVTSGALKGISAVLLERIRAKEASNIAKEMTRSPAVEKKLSIMRRLPDIIKIVHNHFISEKKTAIPFETLIMKTKESYYTAVSLPEIQDWLKLLCELLPDWIYILEVKKGSFVKIDKEKSVEDLIQRLDGKAERLRRGVSSRL